MSGVPGNKWARDVSATVLRLGLGVDSTAMIIGMKQRGERPDFIVFSDTGGEKPETYAYISVLRSWLLVAAFPDIVTVRYQTEAGDTSLEEYSNRTSQLPSRAFGLGGCADKWKTRPLEKWSTHEPDIAALRAAGGKPTALIGYEAGEEHRATIHENARWKFRHPLIEWGWNRDRCIAEILGAGLPIPPKSACFYCPSSTKTEIVALSVQHPELLRRAIAMEDRARASGNLKNVRGLGRRFSWREFVEGDEAARAALPEAPVESCTRCADDSEDRENT